MAKNLSDRSIRKRFGKRGRAWINIEVVENGRFAFLRELCFGGDTSLGKSDILKVMNEHFGIVSGIND